MHPQHVTGKPLGFLRDSLVIHISDHVILTEAFSMMIQLKTQVFGLSNQSIVRNTQYKVQVFGIGQLRYSVLLRTRKDEFVTWFSNILSSISCSYLLEERVLLYIPEVYSSFLKFLDALALSKYMFYQSVSLEARRFRPSRKRCHIHALLKQKDRLLISGMFQIRGSLSSAQTWDERVLP